MPLLSEVDPTATPSYAPPVPVRRQSQHSVIAKSVMNHLPIPNVDVTRAAEFENPMVHRALGPPARGPIAKSPPRSVRDNSLGPGVNVPGSISKDGTGASLTDTPLPSAPGSESSSPRIPPLRQNSGSSTPRIRPTTLDIPGLTRSKASPDGRIASRDIGAKLVIVMVGLPARGKSYITKKVARYLNWLQHDTRIFNVGERRRVAAGDPGKIVWDRPSKARSNSTRPRTGLTADGTSSLKDQLKPLPNIADTSPSEEFHPRSPDFEALPPPANYQDWADARHRRAVSDSVMQDQASAPTQTSTTTTKPESDRESMEQSADFFDPQNVRAARIREQAAMSTLDDVLDFVLDQGGSVGIFDATNSTLERRRMIMEKVRSRAGPELGVLFLESQCIDPSLLESNMRLKLSGPDYKDQDPVASLMDFKKRVAIYEKSYVPLGEFEEKNNIQYVQMIDVGRKIISHQIRGFLAAQTVYYLVNFNLVPRQIWITRHGESMDNQAGKIGGNSPLSHNGIKYARALGRFINFKRHEWDARQKEKLASTHFPPLPGDTTPPNPTCATANGAPEEESGKSVCVWTSMLQRSIQTAQFFDEEEYDIKQMRMLDELNAGDMEGLTYEQIRTLHKPEYELRRLDKLHYRYPGSGGEGYLDVINRLRAVIVEIERMTDHVLLVGHRSVARVLLAYFKGLKREDVADLDVPLGTLYMLEPKPYGVEFQAFRYSATDDWFHHDPDYELRPTTNQTF
ncbi:MAG: hypothetical protein M4579_002575 [Chaenotheca gracillima]|nr:MAG: hypothetical protein M4579_002575 [Chaenotheca gracillima]